MTFPSGSRTDLAAFSHAAWSTAPRKRVDASVQLSPYLRASTSASQASAAVRASVSASPVLAAGAGEEDGAAAALAEPGAAGLLLDGCEPPQPTKTNATARRKT